jgi:AcrR family transcriptional regulator
MSSVSTATRRDRIKARRRAAALAPAALGRKDWLEAARAEFLAGGVDAVKVGRLARRLNVTRGSFYWHFTDRPELLRDLLKSWEQANISALDRVLEDETSGAKELAAIATMWMNETDFHPALDMAVRDWARKSRPAASAVRRVDERRIEVLHRVFKDLGFSGQDALVRARIMYFHQIGYYTLNIHEDPQQRRALAPLYLQILSGLPVQLIDELLAPKP